MKNIILLLILAIFSLNSFSQVVKNEEIVKFQDKSQQEVFQAVKSWAESNSGQLINKELSVINVISSLDDDNLILGFKCIISIINQFPYRVVGLLNVTVKVSVREGRYKIDIKNPEYQILRKRNTDLLYEETSEYLSDLITKLKAEISESNDSW